VACLAALRLLFRFGPGPDRGSDLERRRLEEVDEQALEQLRHPWSIGGETFRLECLEQVEGKVGPNHPGQIRQATAEAKAER
jgi:hypothetical protein